jgi:serine O-acetyltransferase
MVEMISRDASGDKVLRDRHPNFFAAVIADARITAAHRGERYEFRSRLDGVLQAVRLAAVSDAFLGQALYRLKARTRALGIPVIGPLAHRLAMIVAQVSIGDPVVVAPGVYLQHGQVVIDGLVEVQTGVTIAPFVTIGLIAGDFVGPVVEHHVSIGTGAKILGPVRIGAHARIGANTVVLEDVPPGTTAVGVPARIMPTGRDT